MGNLSGLTIGNTTFPVGAGGGGSGVIEGEYDIAQVRCCNASGALAPSGQTNILSQGKTHVWYQRQGKFTRFVIRSEATAKPYSSYNMALFYASDLIGDGKIVPAGQDPSFVETIVTIASGTMPITVTNIGFVTPSCGFVKSKNSATADDYILVPGPSEAAVFANAGIVCVISGTVVWES